MPKLKTIKLQGKDYVQVVTRLAEFHKEFKGGMIETEPTLTNEGKTVIFKAKVTPDFKLPNRFFVGHSFGTTSQLKALEKLETVAVGRALAFLGIGIEGGLEIASNEEMDIYNKKVKEEQKELQPTDMEKMGICDTCGKTAIKAKRTNGTLFTTCPDWSEHRDKGIKFKIVQPPQVLDPKMESFSKSLDEIPKV